MADHPWARGKAQPTGYALENPDPIPAHLQRPTDGASGPDARGRGPSSAVAASRDYALRLALIQAGLITTAQLAEAERALGIESSNARPAPTGP